MIAKNTISKLNHFIILQYIESSFESHFIVVPKNPNIPEPKMPPPPPPRPELLLAIIDTIYTYDVYLYIVYIIFITDNKNFH